MIILSLIEGAANLFVSIPGTGLRVTLECVRYVTGLHLGALLHALQAKLSWTFHLRRGTACGKAGRASAG